MAPPKIMVALAVAALSICGANAGLCRPSSTTEAVSSTTAAPSSTSLTTESSSTISTSTTTTAVACQETQVLSNPSFDENLGFPWLLSGDAYSSALVTSSYARSGSSSVKFSGNSGDTGGSLSQTVYNLDAGTYYLKFYFTVQSLTTYGGENDYGCTIFASLGGSSIIVGYSDPSQSMYPSFTQGTGSWSTTSLSSLSSVPFSISVSCSGDYDAMVLLVDDVTLSTQCNVVEY